MEPEFGVADDFYNLLLALGATVEEARVYARRLESKVEEAGYPVGAGEQYVSNAVQYLALVEFRWRLQALKLFGLSPGLRELYIGLIARDWFDNEAVAGAVVALAGYEHPVTCPRDLWVTVMTREEAKAAGVVAIPAAGLERKSTSVLRFGPKFLASVSFEAEPVAVREVEKEEVRVERAPAVSGEGVLGQYVCSEVGAAVSAKPTGDVAKGMVPAHGARATSFEVAVCAGLGDLCRECSVSVGHVPKELPECGCGRSVSTGLVPAVSLQDVQASARQGNAALVVWRGDVTSSGVGRPGFVEVGAYVTEVHGCGGYDVNFRVEAVGMVLVPAGVKVEFPGGEVLETGGTVVRLVGVGGLQFKVLSGLEEGSGLALVVGNHRDKVRWMHRHGAFDTRGTGARFWSGVGARLALLRHTAENGEFACGGWNVTEDGDDADSAFMGFYSSGVAGMPGVGVYEIFHGGYLESGQNGTAIVVLTGRVRVSTGLKGSLAFELGGGQKLVWLSGFELDVDVKGMSMACVARVEDEYELDGGGPSDDEGFESEF